MSAPTQTAAQRERQLLPVASPAQVRSHVRALMQGRGPALTLAIIMMIGDSALGLVGPIAIGQITQAIADHQNTDALIAPVVLLAAATLAAVLTGWASTMLLARVVLPAVARLRETTLSAAVRLPIDTVEAGGTGDLVSRVSGDVDRVSDAAEGTLGSFLGAGLTILATLVGLASLDWRFALAGLLAVPVQAQTLRWYLRTSRPIYAGGRIADGRRASALLIGFTALPTLRALNLGHSQRERIAAASTDSMDYEFRATRTATRFFGRLNSAEFIGLGAILLIAFILVHNDLAGIGAATTAALFFAGLFNPINTVLGVFDSIQQATAGLARLIGITANTPENGTEAQATTTAAEQSRERSSIGVADVRFAYATGHDVLHEVTFGLKPGQHLAVVGATGSGKSTLASLLAGMRYPRTGSISIGGRPTTQITGRALHHRVALITQETHLFTGTIADNIRLARPDASAAQITATLNAIEATGWIDALPEGIDTPVGTGGTPLTPSQAQQLALARVLLLDPDVIILDEATAEGGSEAARNLDRAAAAVIKDRSAVIIAHRLSQAVTADIIITMKAGRIIERGTHEQLHAAGGDYAALWAAWSQNQ